MSKLTELSQCLVSKYGLSQAEADNFVKELFNIIREKIEADRQVKVKGLGTFKLAEMNARESVDVNTGDRILIEGRYKLTFTPENTVRDRINSPFAQFESVELDEEIDFSAIDEKYEPEETEEEIAGNAERKEVEPRDAKPLVVQQVIVGEPVVESVVEQPAEESIKEAQPEVDDTPTVRSPYCEDLIREGISHSRRIIRLLYGLLFLVVVVLMVFGGYFCYQIGLNAGMKNTAAVPVKDTVALAEPIDTAKVVMKSDSLAADTVVKKEVAVAAKPVNIYTDSLQQAIYNRNTRVRTGAYMIVGHDTTVVAVQGQTFRGICKAYLGSGMECYVEVFNDGKKDVKPGDSIKIPKIKWKRKNRR